MSAQADDYRGFLVSYGGGYLRNVLWSSESTCSYCSGIPRSPEYASCHQCEFQYRRSPETSDLRGFVSYGWNNSQSATVMYGYKESRPPQQARRVVTLMLWYALQRHLRCATDRTYGAPQYWTTVPSLKRRDQPQQLHEIAAGILRNMPEVRVSASEDVGDPRSFRPENFKVSGHVTGRHVLVIDDTWATGGHAESVCGALKRSGASRVTLLVLARWLDPSRGVTDEFIRSELTEDFDPERCPFGSVCP